MGGRGSYTKCHSHTIFGLIVCDLPDVLLQEVRTCTAGFSNCLLEFNFLLQALFLTAARISAAVSVLTQLVMFFLVNSIEKRLITTVRSHSHYDFPLLNSNFLTSFLDYWFISMSDHERRTFTFKQ